MNQFVEFKLNLFSFALLSIYIWRHVNQLASHLHTISISPDKILLPNANWLIDSLERNARQFDI